MGVTELGRMMKNDPNLALSVLYGLGRREAGRSGGGMGPQRKGWVRVGEEGGETSSSRRSTSSSSTSSTNGERTPPTKTTKPKPLQGPQGEDGAGGWGLGVRPRELVDGIAWVQ